MDVFECKCESSYQDKLYGKQKRVHNPTTKGYRCTVCNIEKTNSSSGEKKKNK